MRRRTASSSNELVESQLTRLAKAIERRIQADVLIFSGPIFDGVAEVVRDGIEARKPKRPKLAFLLETRGGYIETAQRIVDILRHHYPTVDFYIPNRAMSAGTVLAMSGDSIFMDYYSIMGPIDPQLERADGQGMVPALGYLIQYERLIDKSRKGKLTSAELGFLIQKFDPAELYDYEQARELSITLLKEWLVKYKFKNWKTTNTRKLKVTDKMKVDRAAMIAKELNNTAKWHSHGRGISLSVLTDELNLQIEDLGKTPEAHKEVREYYGMLSDYMGRRGHSVALHTNGVYRGS
jgi:membrane-bound ClpP family serine protease